MKFLTYVIELTKDIASDIRENMKMRIATVIVLSGLNSYIALPAWRLITENSEVPLLLALSSLVVSSLFVYIPFLFTSRAGHYGWYASDWEELFSMSYAVIGVAVLPGLHVAGTFDVAYIFLFMAASVIIFLFLTAWTLLRNPVNGNKKSTT